MMEHGDEHAELVGKQMLNKKCHGFDNAAMGGVIGWKLLKRVLQCTRIMMASPAGLEMMVRREVSGIGRGGKGGCCGGKGMLW